MAKAQTAKTKTTAAKAPATIGEMIPIAKLSPSPTNPRKRFPKESLEELAASVKEKGILEPLLVRDGAKGMFEIVCGERRYRAAKLAKLSEAPCIKRELADEEVLDIQIHENLHREDVHPMDEAAGYKFLQDKLECTIEDLSLRVGKPESYVLNRLKLNALIEEAQKDVEDGFLPLTHALEIAKFGPESQERILQSGAYHTEQVNKPGVGWVYTPLKTEPNTFATLKQWVEKNILYQLSRAPFDRKSEALRIDGLSCVKCPERTGANTLLFDAEMVGKKDRCLNPTCWNLKLNKHIELLREKIAHDRDCAVDEVPFVNSTSWGDRTSGEHTVYGYDSFWRIDPKAKDYIRNLTSKECDKQILAIDLAEDKLGTVVSICWDQACKTHYGQSTSSSSSSSRSSSGKQSEKAKEAELIKKRERREELFDVAVGERTRKRVFRSAADKFAEKFAIVEGGTDFLPLLLSKLWVTSNNGSDAATKNAVVSRIMIQIMDMENDFSFEGYEQEGKAAAFAKLSPANQSKMLFLFVHGNKGHMYYGGAASQKSVRALADEYGIDHQLIDAEERLVQASKKAKPDFEKYLQDVRDGKRDGAVPRQFTATYKAKD